MCLIATGSPAQLLNVAIEHRLMHAETLAYMLHQLPLAYKVAQPQHQAATHSAPAGKVASATMVKVPAGRATLGMPKEAGLFGWDNEYDALQVDVDAFEIDRHMVSNGAYREFVDAGGPATLVAAGDRRASAMGARRLDRQP